MFSVIFKLGETTVLLAFNLGHVRRVKLKVTMDITSWTRLFKASLA